MPVTYFVALPFVRNAEGELVPGEAQDRQSASASESLARRMAETAAGAVAFSPHWRAGDERLRGRCRDPRLRRGAEDGGAFDRQVMLARRAPRI